MEKGEAIMGHLGKIFDNNDKVNKKREGTKLFQLLFPLLNSF